MKLILLANPEPVINEHAILCDLFENGLSYFHLRKPSFSESDFSTYLNKIPAKFHERIILHTYHNLAKQYAVKGIHYSGENPFKSKIDDLKHLQQSISCHTFDELREIPEHFEYAFISPIFNSISKSGYNSPFDMDKLQTEVASISKLQTIALGGIDKTTIPQAKAYGFDGVGVLGGVWMADKPVDTFIELNNLIQSI